ncbi:hypothetical protein K474DRAFT_1672677 [Panus rudis PR-1116 ss-1]|nr:hypothetical protein K474DRAFT_1672677 [Panus rudis PR-1116 ss-1]
MEVRKEASSHALGTIALRFTFYVKMFTGPNVDVSRSQDGPLWRPSSEQLGIWSLTPANNPPCAMLIFVVYVRISTIFDGGGRGRERRRLKRGKVVLRDVGCGGVNIPPKPSISFKVCKQLFPPELRQCSTMIHPDVVYQASVAVAVDPSDLGGARGVDGNLSESLLQSVEYKKAGDVKAPEREKTVLQLDRALENWPWSTKKRNHPCRMQRKQQQPKFPDRLVPFQLRPICKPIDLRVLNARSFQIQAAKETAFSTMVTRELT